MDFQLEKGNEKAERNLMKFNFDLRISSTHSKRNRIVNGLHWLMHKSSHDFVVEVLEPEATRIVERVGDTNDLV